MQETTGKCIYVPYWDWERDAGWERFSDVMHPATFGSWGGTTGWGCVSSGITTDHAPFLRSPGVNGGPPGCVTRDFLNGFSFHGEAQVLGVISNYNQFGDTTGNARWTSQSNPAPQGSTNSFRVEMENGPHMVVHGVISGHMSTNWSPADPLFYLHHSNVDRLWTMWQDYWDHDLIDVANYTAPWHYDSVWGLDERLPYRPSMRLSSWDFRMEYPDSEPEFPTVRDVMNNDGPLMSVRYQNSYLNSLMPDYEPNPRLFTAATDSVPVRCDRDEWEWARKRRILEEQEKQETDSEETEPEQKEHETDTEETFLSVKDVTHILRTSLRGDDAEDIENNPESYFRSPDRFKHNQVGNGMDIRSSNIDLAEATHDYCGRPPVFTMQEDRDEWDRLCQELPESTSMAERLALLAESNCNRRGNPRSDAPEFKERISITMMKAFDAPSSAYECFSRPEN